MFFVLEANITANYIIDTNHFITASIVSTCTLCVIMVVVTMAIVIVSVHLRKKRHQSDCKKKEKDINYNNFNVFFLLVNVESMTCNPAYEEGIL